MAAGAVAALAAPPTRTVAGGFELLIAILHVPELSGGPLASRQRTGAPCGRLRRSRRLQKMRKIVLQRSSACDLQTAVE